MKKLAKWTLMATCAVGLTMGGGYVGASMALNSQIINQDLSDMYLTSLYYTTSTIEDDLFINDDFNVDTYILPASVINPLGEVLSLPDLFIGANPAVVAISTETTGRNAFGRVVTLPAAGSGFIVSADGYIVTNNHVIENANRISVLLYDGTVYPATVIGRDPSGDLAVLKIEAENLSYLTFGDSDTLQVGEQVAAIGNPLGEFANSMTVGYVSALDREINIDGIPLNMLQTDAAVNKGNSGGPLLNTRGQVVGVVTAKSGGTNVEGLGFAIPSNIVTETVTRLINAEPTPGRPIMGVTIVTFREGNQTRVRIEYLTPGGGAEAAGVLVGDIILSANGRRISNNDDLTIVMESMSPGDTLNLGVLRNGQELLLDVILGENPVGRI